MITFVIARTNGKTRQKMETTIPFKYIQFLCNYRLIDTDFTNSRFCNGIIIVVYETFFKLGQNFLPKARPNYLQ